jgi:chromosomal replication initiator protein
MTSTHAERASPTEQREKVGSVPRVPNIESIQREVSAYLNVRLPDLKSQMRHQAVARPRMIAMYLSRKLTTASFPEIGKHFGGKDHSTVINAFKKIERLITEDSNLRSVIDTLEERLHLISAETTPPEQRSPNTP